MNAPTSPNKTAPDAFERIAFAVALALAGGAIVYWVIQIRGVIGMLKMAYG